MAKPKSAPAPTEKRARDNTIILRVDDTEKETFARAAAAAGLDLTTWFRILARKATGMVTM